MKHIDARNNEVYSFLWTARQWIEDECKAAGITDKDDPRYEKIVVNVWKALDNIVDTAEEFYDNR